MATALKLTISLPNLSVQALAAGMLDQVVRGFEKEPLMNDDLARLGMQAREARNKA